MKNGRNWRTIGNVLISRRRKDCYENHHLLCILSLLNRLFRGVEKLICSVACALEKVINPSQDSARQYLHLTPSPTADNYLRRQKTWSMNHYQIVNTLWLPPPPSPGVMTKPCFEDFASSKGLTIETSCVDHVMQGSFEKIFSIYASRV